MVPADKAIKTPSETGVKSEKIHHFDEGCLFVKQTVQLVTNTFKGRITEKAFAELLLTYADYTSKKKAVVLKRVKKRYGAKEDPELLEGSETEGGIALEEYFDIFSILVHIDDLDKVRIKHTSEF